ncbi:MFS transporter [Treponema denticola]|uniref:MFS transporter n=1 Tax=Treponema denticola TaxID=158 RepID=UPI00208DD65A|nr:MFS transporter [Treponema denticola]
MGAKKLLLQVSFFLVCSIYVTDLRETFYFFCSVLFFAGISDAFLSGSLEGWLVSENKKIQNEKNNVRVFSISRTCINIFSVVSILLIARFIDLGINRLFIFAGIGLFILSGAAFFIFPDNKAQNTTIKQNLASSVKELFHNQSVLQAGLILASLYTCFSIYILIWQNMAHSLSFTNMHIPLLRSITLIGGGVASYTARKARTVSAKRKIFTICFILIAVSFCIMAVSSSSLIFFKTYLFLQPFTAAMFIYGLGTGAVIPLFYGYLSEVIKGEAHASVFSLVSGFASLVGIGTTIGIGIVIDYVGFSKILIVGAVFSGFIGVIIAVKFGKIKLKQ